VKSRVIIALAASAGLTLTSCEYVRLLRPSVLKQLNPRVVRLVNEFPEVDRPNEAIVARLFAHGGLSRADRGNDGVFRTRIYAPRGQYLWYPSVIVMESVGGLEVEFSNDDEITHGVLMPGGAGDHAVAVLPVHQGARVRVHLSNPGLYSFSCPVSNHAGRGMFGVILVKGDVPPEARLDRPKQPRP
jgi:PQQ system protein